MTKIVTLVRNNVIAFVLMFMLVGGTGYAVADLTGRDGTTGPVIYACVHEKTRAMQLGGDRRACPAGYVKIKWSAAGQKGDVGATGPAGTAGVNGDAGVAGAKGDAGAAGAKGNDGAAGNDGAPGGTGPAGPAGPVGPLGPVGPTGADGEQGADGPAGPTGADGAEGPEGPEGPAGPAGSGGGFDHVGGGTIEGFAVANGSNATVIEYSNGGGEPSTPAFDRNSGEYTAPEDGTYLVYASATNETATAASASVAAGSELALHLYRDTSVLQTQPLPVFNVSIPLLLSLRTYIHQSQAQISRYVQLAAGQKLSLWMYNSGAPAMSFTVRFSVAKVNDEFPAG